MAGDKRLPVQTIPSRSDNASGVNHEEQEGLREPAGGEAGVNLHV